MVTFHVVLIGKHVVQPPLSAPTPSKVEAEMEGRRYDDNNMVEEFLSCSISNLSKVHLEKASSEVVPGTQV